MIPTTEQPLLLSHRTHNNGLRIRLLNTADLPDLTALSAGAGWNQTIDDWRMLLALAPDTCLGVDCDGCLAATTTLVCYGTHLAWAGMVLTAPRFQRQGFARALVTRALELARERHVETVKLDATAEGQPLYESTGFVRECVIERWFRGDVETADAPAPHYELQKVLDIDRSAFPGDRSAVLKGLFGRSQAFGVENGYLLCRPGRRASYIGPFICRDCKGADELLTLSLAASGNSFIWDLFPGNETALALAQRHGFSRERILTRMFWGKRLPEHIAMIYGIAGFELG